MKQSRTKDGIHVSNDFLKKNGDKLKQIAQSNQEAPKQDGRVLNLWKPLAVAATLAVALFFATPSEESNFGDSVALNVEGMDLLEMYADGYLDIDEELLYEEINEEDLYIEVELEETELNSILDDLSDDELYNLMDV